MVKSVSSPMAPWLLFLPQLPAKPDYARVKLWRRLQPLGVVGLRGGVYVLPNTSEAREDLEWIGKEVEAAGGTAVVCEATFIEGLSDADLRARFRERATYAFQEIADRARSVVGEAGVAASARRLRKLLEGEQQRDLFGASHRGEAERAVAALEASLRTAALAPAPSPAHKSGRGRMPRGAVWVTRSGVFVDRIASAWLIRRFIDPRATFKFVAGPRYAAHENEIRFDMFQGEYTHRAERCTFETLLEAFGLTSPALAAIGEIVHDIDLKDERYQRPETDGVAHVLQGLARAQPDDSKRVKAGAQIFDSLFAQFSAEYP